MANKDTIQRIYEAFGRSDIAAIIAQLADDVEWEYGATATNVPWLQTRRGRAEVPVFFQALLALDIHKFQPKAIVESGDLVIAVFDFEATVRSTGRRIAEEDEVHLWYFTPQGQVARFRHRIDTHQHVLAASVGAGV